MKRQDTFNEYHTERVSSREEHVRKALKLLSNASYSLITNLADDVAKIVFELEKKSAKKEEDVKPINRSTLIRKKSKYRHLLLSHLDVGTGEANTDGYKAELDRLIIHCAHLEHENTIMRDRLDALGDPKRQISASEGCESDNRHEDIKLLIQMLDAITSEIGDMFETIDQSQTDKEHPDPGLYGPYGLITTYKNLERLQELRNECK